MRARFRYDISTNTAIFVVSNVNAVVDGFTITNGRNRGVWLANGTIRNCTLVSNGRALAEHGGGFYMITGIMSNCLIVSNFCGRGGGGGNIFAGSIVDCVFSNNRADWGGSGILCQSTNAILTRCRIVNNKGGGGNWGGAVNGGTLRNCLIAHNVCMDKAAGALNATLENCTVVNNSLSSGSGGAGADSCTLKNCIVYFNTGGALNVLACTATYTCTTPKQPGYGNIDNDPMFVDFAAYDFHLRFGSKAIDAGMTLTNMPNDLDRTNARPQNSYGATNAYDMGCYEAADHTTGVFRCRPTASPAAGLNSVTSTCTAFIAGDPAATNVTYYGWDFGDGHTEAGPGKWRVTNIFGLGRFNLTLIVSNDLNAVTNWVETNAVLVASTSAYVAVNGTGSFPYISWKNAASNINDAVDAAHTAWDGGAMNARVWVSNGTYAIDSPITLSGGVRVQSVAGRDNTMVTRNTNITINIFSLYHSNAVVSGFTISNGNNRGVYMTNGVIENCVLITNIMISSLNGGGFYMVNGLMSNCVITKNSSARAGQAGAILSGEMVDCVISNNYGAWGPAGVLCETTNAILTRCRIVNNRGGGGNWGCGANGGTLRNCLIAYNVGPDKAAGALRVNLENCTVVSNVLTSGGGGGGTDECTLKNCIVYFNFATSSYPNVKGVAITNSCTTNPVYAGSNNISGDPCFVNLDGGNFHLRADSPCINTGTNQAWMFDGVDLDGNQRIARQIVDMGAYEVNVQRRTVMVFH